METFQRFINPWLLHLQKFGLELKCPLCLNLLNRPALLPCNHIFCNFCIPRATQFGSECPTCKHQFVDREIRLAPYMENMITIYRSLDATINASLIQPASFDAARESDPCPVSTKTKADHELQKEHFEAPQVRNPNNGPSVLSLTANKRAYASHDVFIENGVDFTVKNPIQRGNLEEEWEMCGGNEMDFNAGEKLMPLLLPVQEGNDKHTQLGAGVSAVSEIGQLSPISPPSFGDTKEMDVSSGSGSLNNSVEKSTTRRLLADDLDRAGGVVNNKSTSNCHTRDAKRQKNLNNGFFEINTKGKSHSQQNNLSAENINCSNVLEGEFQEPLSCEQSTVNLDLPNSSTSVCAFCFSSVQSDGTGQMLHYSNGKEVVGDAIGFSNVIHVHEKCIDWSPQVYYKGSEIKNLESELARAGKLKCSTCGQKGAAVGCFVKNCKKSYHLPCALNLDCRWETDDFLMLCPIHKSIKFPREKRSKSRKQASGENKPMPTQTMPRQPNVEAEFPSAPKEWVLCGSALSVEEKRYLLKFASSCGASVSRNWSTNVTHVIAATDENGACTRTLKVLMAILNGKWILTMDWIKACVKAKQLVCEEPYEVKLDNHGCNGGPRAGRLWSLQNSEKLFTGLKFYFVGDFLEAYKNDLISLIKTAGGIVIKTKMELFYKNFNTNSTKNPLVVYNDDPTQKSDDEEDDGSIGIMRLIEAETLAAEINASMVTPSWILDSIAACNLMSLTF